MWDSLSSLPGPSCLCRCEYWQHTSVTSVSPKRLSFLGGTEMLSIGLVFGSVPVLTPTLLGAKPCKLLLGCFWLRGWLHKGFSPVSRPTVCTALGKQRIFQV